MIYINFDDLMKNKMVNGKKLTMLQLSKDTGISRANLYNLKKGKAKGVEFNTLNTLIKYFNVPINSILKYSSERIDIDLYNYKHFFNYKDIKEIYNYNYHQWLEEMIRDYGKEYFYNHQKEMEIKTNKIIHNKDITPLKEALYVQYTSKNKTFWHAMIPSITESDITINPKISIIDIPNHKFIKYAENITNMFNQMDYHMNEDSYYHDVIIKHLPNNQRLFLLCKTIQFTNMLENKTTITYASSKTNGPIQKNKRYANIQEFILNTNDNITQGTDYRMTKDQILNYKQPLENNFNSNIYNFIIRDHTKK